MAANLCTYIPTARKVDQYAERQTNSQTYGWIDAHSDRHAAGIREIAETSLPAPYNAFTNQAITPIQKQVISKLLVKFMHSMAWHSGCVCIPDNCQAACLAAAQAAQVQATAQGHLASPVHAQHVVDTIINLSTMDLCVNKQNL